MSFFKRKNNDNGNVSIERSRRFLSGFQKWLTSPAKIEQLLAFQSLWDDWLITGKKHHDLKVLDTPYSKGIVFTTGNIFKQDHGKYLIDYFMYNLKEAGYYTYRSVQKGDGIYVTQSHYLKPKFDIKGIEHYDQLFGNVFIEVHSMKGTELFVKVQTNYYSGRNYSKPLAFEDLINVLTNYKTS